MSMTTGRLFYVIGASGAGKDSLLGYTRDHLSPDARVVFAHRYITRPAASGGENHIALSEVEFARRLSLGCFAMHWCSHDLSYGIGIEINQWLTMGLNVVMNGSRGYLDEATRRYPDLIPVLISVPALILGQRLRVRGRESEPEIAERLQRANAFSSLEHPRLAVIDNDASLETAGERLIQLISDRNIAA